MNNSDLYGYLIVKVTTARGAIPLEGASVNIRGGKQENSQVMYSMRTNRDGQTQKVARPAPPRSASQTPSDIPPYSVYNVDVNLDGYVPLFFQNVPIFSGVVSIQPAVMTPTSSSYQGAHSPYEARTNIPESEDTDLM